MQSKAKTVAQYLAELPEDRRNAIEMVRRVILQSLDADYEEGMQYGMIGYYVPHRVYPPGYHCDPRQPLPFAGLASQKNHMSLYMMCIYSDATPQAKSFRTAWARTGKKLDMGKCCIRFKKVDDLALEVIGDTLRSCPAKVYVAYCEKALSGRVTAQGNAAQRRPAKRGAAGGPGSASGSKKKAPDRKAATRRA